MRPIFFIKYYDKGSTEFGGHQVSDALRIRGYRSDTLYARDLDSVRDSILVFIKTSKIQHLVSAKRRNRIDHDQGSKRPRASGRRLSVLHRA